MLKIKPFIFVLLFSACHPIGSRQIASSIAEPPELDNLLEASQHVLKDVSDERFDSTVCVSYLGELEKRIDDLDYTKIPKNTLVSHGVEIANNSWKIRSLLHKNLSSFDDECIFQIQKNFKQFRFVEEYLLEIANKVEHKNPKDIIFQNEPIPILNTEPNFYSFYSSDYAQPKYLQGDMMVTRGVSFLSSMIARLGKRDTQFSHIVFVNENPKTKKLRTIESYVGVGVGFYEMDFALKNENARILWLRSKDLALGKLASEKIGALVDKSIETKKIIKYDYELNFDDPKTMSCAEVSQVAFQLASNGEFKIPYYPNKIEGAKSLIDRLNIPEGPTYEPGDMEIDPRFELVGEFRDLRLTRDSRQKDAIMSAIFSWMNHKNYVLKDNFKSKMAGGIIYDIRRTFLWPLIKRVMKLDDFSKEIPRNMIRTVTLIGELGEQLQAELIKQDLAFEKIHGIPMAQVDLNAALEKIREEDFKLYSVKKTRKKSKFHKMFSPPK